MHPVHRALAEAKAALANRQTVEADHFLHQAATLAPDEAELLCQVGVTVAELGRPAAAVPVFERATRAGPGFAPAFLNLGVALAHTGRTAEAAVQLERAVALDPVYADAHFNLGNVLRDLKRPDEAVARYREAVRLRPDHPGAHNNLGLALVEGGAPEEAAVLLKQAVRLEPTAKEFHNNLGLALTDLGRFAEAEAAFERALAVDPTYAEGHANLAGTHAAAGRPAEAVAGYDLALRLQPESATTRYNRSLALLKCGDYARGFAEYEWRWRKANAPTRLFPFPRWDGRAGQSVFLWCEQGLGDAIQFVRFARRVRERAASVVVECPPPLVELFSTCPGIDRVVPEGAPPPDCYAHCPLMSVPTVLGLRREEILADDGPYLSADPRRAAFWREWVGRWPGRKVGIAWQGNPRHKHDRFRSLPVRTVVELAAGPGTTLVSLQRGHGAEQLREWRGRPEVVTLPDDPPDGWTVADTAAVVASLDEVVAVDTSVAHLAGALGVPVRVWLGRVSDWRWGTAGEDTGWYPSMTLIRSES